MSLDTAPLLKETSHVAVTPRENDPFGGVTVTATLPESESAARPLRVLLDTISRLEATPITMECFGPGKHLATCREELIRLRGREDWPSMWIVATATGGPTSIQVRCLRGVSVERLRHGGRVIGSVTSEGIMRVCRLAGVMATDGTLSAGDQTRKTFRIFCDVLRDVGMDYSDVARTWFYNDQILDWYADFNRARNDFYEEDGVFDRLVPASTGIGGANLDGAALISGLIAMDGPSGQIRREMVASPLQNAAWDYGSSFSRAMEINVGPRREVFVSGTASITPDGETAHVGDVRKQIDLTMAVVTRLIESRGLTWAEAHRAIAYIPRAEYLKDFRAFLAEAGLEAMPVIVAVNTVCRGDLLFEIEVDVGRCLA